MFYLGLKRGGFWCLFVYIFHVHVSRSILHMSCCLYLSKYHCSLALVEQRWGGGGRLPLGTGMSFCLRTVAGWSGVYGLATSMSQVPVWSVDGSAVLVVSQAWEVELGRLAVLDRVNQQGGMSSILN